MRNLSARRGGSSRRPGAGSAAPLLKRARSLERRNRIAEAADLYRRAARRRVGVLPAYAGLVRCLFQLRDWPAAERALAEAVRKGAPRFATYFAGGNALLLASRYDDAARMYREALRRTKSSGSASIDPRIHYRMGFALARINRHLAAASSYRRYLDMFPRDVDAWFNLGSAYRESGAVDRSRHAFGQAVALEPSDHEAWNNLGNSCATLGDTHAAIAAFRTALALKPDYHPAWNNLGNVLQVLDRHEEAIACYDRAIKLQGGNEPLCYFNRALSLIASGRTPEALRDLHRWALLPPFHEAAARGARGPDWVRLLRSIAPRRARQSTP